MAPKNNANKWTDVQMAIAAISVTSMIAFWNMFAGVDRTKADEKAKVEEQTAPLPTVTAIVETPPPTPMPSMPPTGYKILFGGVAPQPQVVVVRQPGRGGGGNNEDNGGGGGGAATTGTNTVTTTSSS